MSEIINKVASSGIITLDLEELYPQGERIVFDLKPLLWQEIALKEDDLRAWLSQAGLRVTDLGGPNLIILGTAER